MDGFFLCPVCGRPLQREEGCCRCPNGHSFDRARSGYWNLLPPGDRHSKQPGDNKEMVRARWSFLQSGHYEPLARKIAELGAEQLPQGGALLDAGCGEGYYDEMLCREMARQGKRCSVGGMDISKFAVERAAKRLSQGKWAVGSLYHMPAPDACCDLLFNFFAPHCPREFSRVLRPQGKLLIAVPGPEHLWELKELLYDTPYLNEREELALEGFRAPSRTRVRYSMELDSAALWSLFQMTPYFYRTPEQVKARLQNCPGLRVTADFELLLYAKEEETQI